MSVRSFLFVIVIGSACTAVAVEQEYLPDLAIAHPAIQYYQTPVNDAAAQLAKQLESGKAGLEFHERLGYLPSLLDLLGVKSDSQALVFSKTSVQAARISPNHPRAIYFSDEVAVGFVPGSEEIEIAATDSKAGVVFYSLNSQRSEKPAIMRRDICLTCHQGPATSGVPGIFIGSVFPNALGFPFRGESAIITDHRTAFEDRWGGWFVNAKRGQQRDRANAVASNPAEPDVLDPNRRQNVTELPGQFNPAGYMTPVSDIVALMTFEHQTQMTNYITRVGWEARIAQYDGKKDEFTRARLDSGIEAMLAYMLFADEALLPEPVEGVSTFTRTFPQRGARDKRGRSLRDFDLQKRLFRYPLSYMVYSAQFDGLPEAVRDRVYLRLYEVLTGKDTNSKFAKLSTNDRRAILEILRETKANLPGYWRN